MNPQNIYEGLVVEPAKPEPAVERIQLIGKVLSDTGFAFLPTNWEKVLKPYSKAKWSYELLDYRGQKTNPHHYELKQGAFLVFPEFEARKHGGFYAAHLYMIVKELKDLMRRAEFQRVDGTFTGEGLELRPCEPVDGIKTILTLKYRAPKKGDGFYHAILSY